jgi:hypothetical protein
LQHEPIKGLKRELKISTPIDFEGDLMIMGSPSNLTSNNGIPNNL